MEVEQVKQCISTTEYCNGAINLCQWHIADSVFTCKEISFFQEIFSDCKEN